MAYAFQLPIVTIISQSAKSLRTLLFYLIASLHITGLSFGTLACVSILSNALELVILCLRHLILVILFLILPFVISPFIVGIPINACLPYSFCCSARYIGLGNQSYGIREICLISINGIC